MDPLKLIALSIIGCVLFIGGIVMLSAWFHDYFCNKLRAASKSRTQVQLGDQLYYVVPAMDYLHLLQMRSIAETAIQRELDHREFLDRFNRQ